MTRIAYEPSYPVTAAWNLEHMPVVACVVFVQELGNELCFVGSRSWMFPGAIGTCLEELSKFPWEAKRHILRIDDDQTWPELFRRHELHVELAREHASLGKSTAMADAMLERATFDTAPRPWLDASETTNNELLIDSLNGYRVKPLEGADGGKENFADSPLVTYERYFAGAIELLAAWLWARRRRREVRPIDYSAQDRAVI